MSPLNYSRLIISMSNLLENLDSKLYQGTTPAYRAEIELSIRTAIEAAQKSMIRDPFIFTPVELKRWLEGEFDAINERHNVRTPDIVSNDAMDDLEAAVDEAAEGVLADAANEADSDDSAVELTSAASRTGLKRMNALHKNPPRAARRARTAKAAGETMLHQARAVGVRKLAPFRRPVMNTVVRDRVQREVEEDEEDALEAAEALMVLSQHVPRGAAALPPIPEMHVSVRGAFVEGARYTWQVREREEFGDVGFVEMVEEKVGVKGRSFWEVV